MSKADAVRAEIMAQVTALAEVQAAVDKYAREVRDYWRSVSPVDDGDYAASVQVSRKKYTVNGMPARKVMATDFKAHWIEYGTGEPGPTKAAAPRAKTASHFGGDESRVDAILANDDLTYEQRKNMLSAIKMPTALSGDE